MLKMKWFDFGPPVIPSCPSLPSSTSVKGSIWDPKRRHRCGPYHRGGRLGGSGSPAWLGSLSAGKPRKLGLHGASLGDPIPDFPFLVHIPIPVSKWPNNVSKKSENRNLLERNTRLQSVNSLENIVLVTANSILMQVINPLPLH